MKLEVRRISTEQHSAWLDGALASDNPPFVSFLQLPQWGSVKVGWRPESIGWFVDSELVGVALVLYRGVPKLPQRSLAYLPEGPVIDWSGTKLPAFTLADWITPMVAHLRGAGAFAIKMGPPVAVRRWEALADGVCDAAVAVMLEQRKSEQKQDEAFIVRQMDKVTRGLTALNNDLGHNKWCVDDTFSLADIAVGCMLGYINLRFSSTINLAADYPNLERLQSVLIKRQSFIDSMPVAN
jgi:hypothetical protein